MRWRWGILLIVAVAGMAIAFALDASVATIVHEHFWDVKHPGWGSKTREIIKLAGFFPTTIILSLMIAWLHPLRWRATAFLLLTTIPAALNEPIKLIAGRLRPFKAPGMKGDQWMTHADAFAFHTFSIGPRQLFHTPNLSFPSGHAALAFATATGMSILFPRGRVLFFAAATIVGLERITENAHWCSDVAAAVVLGIGGAWIVRKLCSRGNGLLIQPVQHGFKR